MLLGKLEGVVLRRGEVVVDRFGHGQGLIKLNCLVFFQLLRLLLEYQLLCLLSLLVLRDQLVLSFHHLALLRVLFLEVALVFNGLHVFDVKGVPALLGVLFGRHCFQI